jgi:NAD(P)-dependent dehydrogenase (short-subunit alcohol dehydrogenase family)
MLQTYSAAINILIGTGFGAFFAAIFVAQAVALECGFRFGRRQVAREGPQEKGGISTLAASMLGLLGFTLGLTISFAQARFEARRDSVLIEANAISTAWLRASLLDDQEARQLRQLIESYAQTRLAFTRATDPAEVARQIARSDAEEIPLWSLASGAARATPSGAGG